MFISLRGRGGRSVLTLVLVLVLTLPQASCSDSAADDLETASALADQWAAGWNNNDQDAVASVFTEDGSALYTGVIAASWTSRDQIRQGSRVDEVDRLELTGDITVTEEGLFTCPFKWEAHEDTFVGEITFELDGDLISEMVIHSEAEGDV